MAVSSFVALRTLRQSSATLLRRPTNSIFASSKQQQQKRGLALGGHHGPPPEWTGVDKVVRGYFPEDYQLAIAILSAYGGIAILFKIKSALTKPKKAVEAAPSPAASTSSSEGVPAIDSPAFEKFVETDAFYKLLENEEQLKGLVENA